MQTVLKAQNDERVKVLKSLEKSIHHFNLKKFGDSLRDDVTDTLTRVEGTKQDSEKFFTEVLNFIQNMTDQHQATLTKKQQSIVMESFDSYGEYLESAELRDIKLLKKRLYDLKTLAQ
jgi:septal ring factor EnvC (AmiA/AmiB activator)